MEILEYFKSDSFVHLLELLGRLIIALVCGSFIGYERSNRGKGAGIRTHTIVAMASCLMMIVSQYGFSDFFSGAGYEGVELRHDPSRIAAQIVSGIGFLGAGMIFIQKNTITGLTTAAGIWATAGIGMAIGSGMYVLGIATTAIIVLIQFLLHKSSVLLHTLTEREFYFVVSDDYDIDKLIDIFKRHSITVNEMNYERESDRLEIEMLVQFDANLDLMRLMDEFYEDENIRSVKA